MYSAESVWVLVSRDCGQGGWAGFCGACAQVRRGDDDGRLRGGEGHRRVRGGRRVVREVDILFWSRS